MYVEIISLDQADQFRQTRGWFKQVDIEIARNYNPLFSLRSQFAHNELQFS